ncbi:serine hydrolase domain-containing protein [Virgisporangium aurantiacum]|uniref:Serine hydrolase n=1 Tax=Virgisporangium aurantiacum TaxID=175570 RepID=A0A8J4E2L6_9ACTN|nr:serine hydrolase domain-containing protein [Virgisporangium aurantiacum]GIJ57162.1 serine hydrolase [Virgisporangium aurantiacum]
MLRHLIATAAVAATVGAVPTPAPARSIELRRNAEAVHALGVPAVQAWASDGRHAAVVRVGVADIRTGRPVPPNGAFRIASTAKTLTATVILQLVGEGRLSVDDPVERWLPGVVHGRAITVRQLLQHTSGLRDALPGWETEAEYYRMRYQRDPMAELVERSVARGWLFEPGEGWSYSTAAYLIADMIIERVTGRPWHREFERRIFAPLGLRHTYWPGSSPEIERPHARAYELFDGELVDVTSRFTAYPAGGVVSTTGDLDRFFRALLGGRLLRPTELAAMMDTVPVSADVEPIWPGGLYGLGLVSRELPCGGRYWGHDGGDAGTITTVGVTADGRRGAVVNANLALDDTVDHLLTQLHTTDRVVTDALC